MTKVKICGITNKEDAFWASSLGADFVGLNFHKNSLRKVSVKNAIEIVRSLPDYTSAVALFVNEEKLDILKTLRKTGIIYVQLHGEQTPQFCSELKQSIPNLRIIKVIKVKPGIIENEIDKNNYVQYLFSETQKYLNIADYMLYDTYVDDVAGGSGESFNWDYLVELKKLFSINGIIINFFVAGGLTSQNVSEVIEKVEPYGVDVSSGVERLPRRKDYDKMKDFIRLAKK